MNSIIVNKEQDDVEIRFADNLTADNVEELRKILKKILSENVKKITMDFHNIDMIDSMGIGLLVSTHNTLISREGELIIKNLSGDLLELFTVMRLNEFFKIES